MITIMDRHKQTQCLLLFHASPHGHVYTFTLQLCTEVRRFTLYCNNNNDKEKNTQTTSTLRGTVDVVIQPYCNTV